MSLSVSVVGSCAQLVMSRCQWGEREGPAAIGLHHGKLNKSLHVCSGVRDIDLQIGYVCQRLYQVYVVTPRTFSACHDAKTMMGYQSIICLHE